MLEKKKKESKERKETRFKTNHKDEKCMINNVEMSKECSFWIEVKRYFLVVCIYLYFLCG
jgi:hypothetical protein